jgi:16S rRNA (guanine966-N2)-methyltransferase
MRIVAGSAKGVRLAPVPEGVRPLSDRAREGLFSSLGAEVAGARVLDLFAGTGAMGIEALSRGAEHAVFVDRFYGAIAAVHDNLERARVSDRANSVTSTVFAYLGRAPGAAPFHLVFLDPPYEVAPAELDACLEALSPAWLDPDGWTVVLTRGPKSSTPVIPLHWSAARELRYGDSHLHLYRPLERPRDRPEPPA